HLTPGAGVIYRIITDIPPRADTYGPSVRGPRRTEGAGEAGGAGTGAGGPSAVQGQNRGQTTSDGLGVGRGGDVAGNLGPPAPGTGAHGQQVQNGKLWIAVPPSRMIYRIEPR